MEGSTSDPGFGPSLAAGFAAVAFGSTVAKVQAAQIKELRAQGISTEESLEIALRTSLELAQVLVELVRVISTANLAETVRSFADVAKQMQ